jgi:hypothetical protein
MEQTSTSSENLEPSAQPVDVLKQLAATVAFVLKAASASVAETHRSFLSVSSSTGSAVIASAETAPREVSPEMRAQLDSILEGVRHDIIEDGISNTVSERLPSLVAEHYRSVLPVLATVIDNQRTSAAVVAEILKEVGRIRDAASHSERRWLLEHALWSGNPAARDGAGAGLAWLRDPATVERVRAAAERETIPQLKSDLEEVFRLLSAASDHGAAAKDNEA